MSAKNVNLVDKDGNQLAPATTAAQVQVSNTENLTQFLNKYEILGGTPLVAATAAAMTNTSKVYVYTGSESGYTNGNWYYYNGSAWVSGGVYNSVAFNTDKTLAVENMAADAEVTGKKISELEDDYNYNKISIIGDLYSAQYVDGDDIKGLAVGQILSTEIGETISFSSWANARHCYISVKEGEIYRVTSRNCASGISAYHVAFTDDNDVVVALYMLSDGTLKTVTETHAVPTGATRMYTAAQVAAQPANWNVNWKLYKLALGHLPVLQPRTIKSLETPWASCAHRGATTDIINGSSQTLYRENTVESIYNAYLKGASWVEIDVRKTSDGVLVLSHDATITGTVDGVETTYTIANETLETLKGLLLGNDSTFGNFRIATFDEALNLARDLGMNVNADCKVQEYTAISDAVVAAGMSGRVMYTTNSLSTSVPNIINPIDINAMYLFPYVNMANIPSNVDKTRTFVNVSYNPTAEICNEIKAAGYLLSISEISYMNFEEWLIFNPLYAEFKTDSNLDLCNRMYIMSKSIYGN